MEIPPTYTHTHTGKKKRFVLLHCCFFNMTMEITPTNLSKMKNKTKENKTVIQENKEFKLFSFQSHPEAKYTYVTGIL